MIRVLEPDKDYIIRADRSGIVVDVIEVVHCKDCKYADENAKCRFVSWYNKRDDFCSRGERREDAKTD